MTTFSPQLKADLLEQIAWHRENDMIAQDSYDNGKKGKARRFCAVGCAIHSLNRIQHKRYDTSDHLVYTHILGDSVSSVSLAHLEDKIFEGLPTEIALDWPARFISAIPADADLSKVLPAFYIAILTDKEHGVKQWAFEDGKKAIDMVVAVRQHELETGVFDENAARSARSAAWSAWSAARSVWSARSARSAAWSAAESARSARSAESAAWSSESARSARSARSERSAARSAWSAAESAWSAAWSERSAAESARSEWSAWSAAESARSAHYIWLADTLIRCIEEYAKVGEDV